VAREHARLWLDINSDDDFETLPFDAQGLYCRVILTLDDLSYCGVARWLPKKLTTKAPDLTLARIQAAAEALEIGRYCLFDLDTEEVLARSFIRRDELLRNPKMAAAVIKAYPGIASKPLRAAVVDEIQRVHKEHPEYSSWTHKDTGPALAAIMAKPGSDQVPYTNQITNGQTVDIGNTDPVRITNTNPVAITNVQSVYNTETDLGADHQSQSAPIPSTYTSTSTPAPKEGGYLSTEGHQGAEPNRPRPHCPRHSTNHNGPCPACQARREWDRDRAAAEAADFQRRRTEFLTEVRNCPDCDPHGWLIEDDDDSDPLGVARRCPRHDWPAHA
jgi:hypothetical protein